MILGVVGTDPRGFQRLVDWLDVVAAELAEPVLVQAGHSPRPPSNAAWIAFEPPAEFQARIAGARVVVAHAGAGTLLACADAGVPVICIPRKKELGEAIDDHQAELAEAVAGRPGFHVAQDPAHLGQLLRKPLGRPERPATRLVERLRADVADLVAGGGRG